MSVTPTAVDVARASTIVQTWRHRLEVDQIDTPKALLEAAETLMVAYHNDRNRMTFSNATVQLSPASPPTPPTRWALWVTLGATAWVACVITAVLICQAVH